jgi:hypothetical protein
VEELDPCAVTRRRGEARVTGDQRSRESLCERDERGVVGRDVVAKLPDSIVEGLVAVADECELGEIAKRIFSALDADLIVHAHPPECVQQLSVYEVRPMQVAVSGEARDQSRGGVARDECLEHRRGIDYEHLSVAVAIGADRSDDRAALCATGACACALEQIGDGGMLRNALELAEREIG